MGSHLSTKFATLVVKFLKRILSKKKTKRPIQKKKFNWRAEQPGWQPKKLKD